MPPAAAAANLEENSPKVRCWLRRSMRPNVATSQKTVVPPLPSTTSQPSGSEKSSASPARSEATTLRTAGWRCEVPRYAGRRVGQRGDRLGADAGGSAAEAAVGGQEVGGDAHDVGVLARAHRISVPARLAAGRISV